MSAEYKSFGSFTPIYEDELAKLYELIPYRDQAQAAEKVFRKYAKHANPIGGCFPGLRRIANLCHYSETTTRRALTLLFQHDYIRAHVETSAIRKRHEETFQVSPYVLWIAPAFIDEALALWQRGLHASKITFSDRNEIINQQPAPESSSRTSTRNQPENQLQNQHHQQNRAFENGWAENGSAENHAEDPIEPKGRVENARNAEQQPEGPKTARSAQTQPVGPESAQTTKKGYVPPDLVPAELCIEPLGDGAEEAYAQELYHQGLTALIQARQLVATYHLEKLQAAFRMVDAKAERGEAVTNKIGLARFFIDLGIVSRGDEEIPVRSRAGKYADYFEK